MSAVDRPEGIFITGTDTGVGKTLIGAALARLMVSQGVQVGVMKPAETGVPDPEQLGPDGELLRWASGTSASNEQICPYRLNEPLAPAVAASRQKIRINYTDLVERGRQTTAENDFTIIEGAGGLMVPLAGGFLMADLARDIGLPLVVVCRPDLGTINHTLLTLFSARHLELSTLGYIINRMPENPGVAAQTAPHSLASMTGDELLAVVSEVEGSDQEKVEKLVQIIPSLPSYPLLTKFLPLSG